jgi:hypothetical protein
MPADLKRLSKPKLHFQSFRQPCGSAALMIQNGAR